MKKQAVGQGQLFDPQKVTSHQFEPVEHIQNAARAYTGGKWQEPNNQLQQDPIRGEAQAASYEKGLSATSNTPRMERSYAAVEEHVTRQYDLMTKPVESGGLGIKHEIVHDDPYPSVQAMAEDVRAGRIKTYATATTTAGDKQAPTEQAFSNDMNDKFRAVHDVFGHAAVGRGFSAHGEEAAYQSHAQMFPKEALPALAAETRGQNSFYVHRGQEFPSPGTRKVDTPDWATTVGKLPSSTSRNQRRAR